ncbi:MAG: P-II family nitrogen regulator [Gammaproteobacteria bacterium]|nr:P-II family nitrogen regulator [Gammaproteobacteria bacterium]
MKLKLIVALVSDDKTNAVVQAARDAGATGATTIPSVRGEGLKPQKTFLGLDLASRRDVVLLVVSETRARSILERIRQAAEMDENPGTGIAIQLDIEDAVGLVTQLPALQEEISQDL